MGLLTGAGFHHDVDAGLGQALYGVGHERHAALARRRLLRNRDFHVEGLPWAKSARRVFNGGGACAVVRAAARLPLVRSAAIALLGLVLLLPASASARTPSVPPCALGTSAADLRGFEAKALAKAEKRYRSPAARRAFSTGVAAYVYGLAPLSVRNTVPRFPLNQIVNIGELVRPEVRTVVSPNVDTTYTVGQINLSDGPRVVDVPDTSGRYYVLQFMDAYSNTFAYIGRRTTGTKPGSYVLVPPGYTGPLPAGVRRLQSPTNLIWLIGRTLVKSQADLAPVVTLMGGFRLTALAAWNSGTRNPPLNLPAFPAGQNKLVLPKGLAYLDELGQSLQENPPPKADACAVKAFRAVGIGAGRTPSTEATGAVRKALAAAVRRGPGLVIERRAPRERVQPGPQQRLGRLQELHRRLRAQLPGPGRDRPLRPGCEHRTGDRVPVGLHGQPRACVQRPPQLPAALPSRAATARGRVLVPHHVHPGRVSAPEPRPHLRRRRSHQGPAQGFRRLAHDHHLEEAPEGRRGRQLAARARRAVPRAHAHLRAPPLGAERPLEAAARHAGPLATAVSQENVEVVREVMRAFNARDDSAMSHWAEDAEFRLIGGFSGMAGENLRGREAILRFAWELIDNLQARFVVERLFEADDRVVLIASTVGAGDASGAGVEWRWGQVYRFRDGLITEVDNYWDADEAMETLEGGAQPDR